MFEYIGEMAKEPSLDLDEKGSMNSQDRCAALAKSRYFL